MLGNRLLKWSCNAPADNNDDTRAHGKKQSSTSPLLSQVPGYTIQCCILEAAHPPERQRKLVILHSDQLPDQKLLAALSLRNPVDMFLPFQRHKWCFHRVSYPICRSQGLPEVHLLLGLEILSVNRSRVSVNLEAKGL